MNKFNRTKKSYTSHILNSLNRKSLTLCYREHNEVQKEMQWIPEFIDYCEKNKLPKNIVYIVPKSDSQCACARFKKLYSSVFDKIECSICDTKPTSLPMPQTYRINLFEYKLDKIPKIQ